MMSLETMRYYQNQAAKKAARSKRKPLQVMEWFLEKELDARIEAVRGIPNFGTYRPKGFYLDRVVLVDKSGFGAEDGLALTLRGFVMGWVQPRDWLAVIEESQFQVVVAAFREGEAPEGHGVEYGRGTIPPR